ncbi:MAG TPA: carbonic anhydrase [Thermodesulfobacteriota bacterium]|nr:carbonic anhydrase [Thermodesulfobacteriota bacterium]
MKFCTVINCMDGRVQLPVIKYLQERFGAEYVDSITEPGPNRILAEQTNTALLDSISTRLKISLGNHESIGIAVAGHHGCAGNPTPKDEQTQHTLNAVKFLKSKYPGVEIIGLWVDGNWEVEEIQL